MKIHYDLLGMAMNDYYQGNRNARIIVHSPDFEEDEIDVSWYFRKYGDMPEIEKEALSLCRGKTLDVGAGAGSHALHLQKNGKDISALDISGGACEVMRARGIKKVMQQDIFTYNGEKYDSLLMLMNGIGVTGEIERLNTFLDSLPDLLNPGGQLLFDSTNLIYLYKNETGSADIDLSGGYYGEVRFRLEYDEFFTEQFSWLYIDYDTLSWMAEDKGMQAEHLMKGDNYHYLARIMI